MDTDKVVLDQIHGVLEPAGGRNAKTERIAEWIRRRGTYRWVGIYAVEGDEIAVLAWSGPQAPAHPRFPASQGLCGAAVRSCAAVVVGNVTKDPRYLTTFSSTRSEIAGTAIGAAVGAVFVKVWGAGALAAGVAVTFAVLLCALLKLLDSYRLAGATVAIVMLASRLGSPWVLAFDRFLEVSLGIVVALLVTTLVWPARAREHLRRGVAEAFTCLGSLFQAVVRRYRGDVSAPLDELASEVDKTLRRNEGLREQAIYEPALGPTHQELLVLLMDHVHRILQAVSALELASRESAGDTYYLKFEPELSELVSRISAAFKRLAESVAAWRFDADWSSLAGATSSLDEKAVAMRKTGAAASYGLDEVLRFYSFLLSLRNLARELDLAHATGSRLLPPAHLAD